MACGCGKKKKGCRGANCGPRSVSSPSSESSFLMEDEEMVDDTVIAAAKESLVIDFEGRTMTWKSGQSRRITERYYQQLIDEGAPIWRIS